MRLVFAGTPTFAAAALDALVKAGHTVVGVLTQPDRPAGRGMKMQASPVKQLAQAHAIAVMQPQRLRSGPDAQTTLDWLLNPDGLGRPDVMVVAAYGLILPTAVLQAPLHGCLNIHASLLPRWRGAAPIHRAIEAGDDQTGITIMQMDEGLDTGDICRMASLPIGHSNSGQLLERLAQLGASEIVAALADLQAGRLHRTPQPVAGVTYANKISREEARLDWHLDANQICHRTAAWDPQPGAWTTVPGNDEVIKLFDARLVDTSHVGTGLVDTTAEGACAQIGTPGQVVLLNADGLAVRCGTGIVQFASAQKAGGRRLPALQALAGLNLQAGVCLGASSPESQAHCG